jgi:hypothetical protein
MDSKPLRHPLSIQVGEVFFAALIGITCGWLAQNLVAGPLPTGIYAHRVENVFRLQHTPIVTGIWCGVCGLFLARGLHDDFLRISQVAHLLMGLMVVPICFAYLPPLGCAAFFVFVIMLLTLSVGRYQGRKRHDGVATVFILMSSIYIGYILIESMLRFTD